MPILSAIGAACSRAFGMFGGSTVSADFLVIAGGGSGGTRGGGGGAGGFRTSAGTSGGGASAESKLTLDVATTYVITVGAGGAGVVVDNRGNNGSDSSIGSLKTSTGGGGGGCNGTPSGIAGGSGGGAGHSGSAGSGGSGTANQGYAGGANYTAGGAYPAGGGGGAGAVGATAVNSTNAGNGGNGVASSITGSSVTYAGGGGGAANGGASGVAGTGGSGGGGNGDTSSGATSGTANLGAGGGGSYNGTSGNGGSGVVIISYPAPQKFGGGVVTTSGSNIIHTFNTSGSLTPVSPITASYLIVAGGGSGAGAGAGGGGAGGLLSGSGLTIDPYSTYLVTVGAGAAAGTSSTQGSNGSNSSFSMVSTVAVGGGAGGRRAAGASGGSGGGGGAASTTYYNGGSGTSGQGNTGGNAGGSAYVTGGGGGAGAVGTNGVAGQSGAGGIGVASSISGTSTYYAGGGGGGGVAGGAGTAANGGAGGSGGGGAGGTGDGASGVAGTANTGGGGGSGVASNVDGQGGAGGSGVVIISYPGSTQLMAGGTVTISGGNVIHTFTSTGYLAPIKYLSNSLRFRSSASASLTKTFSSDGTSNTIQTISVWVKRGQLGSNQVIMGGYDAVEANQSRLQFTSSDTINLRLGGSAANDNITTAVFRDPSAWYHIVAAIDTTQATLANRAKIYVNGVQQTVASPSCTQNQITQFANGSTGNTIGEVGSFGSTWFDGYMTEFYFIDGQALTPNSFGTSNSYGVWQPIAYAGSYGKNGFYLPFSNTSSTTTIGYDYSGNSNNWTSNNISLTAGSTYDAMTDVPTLTSATAANYCVINPLDNYYMGGTISDGNLQILTGYSSNNYITGTQGVSSGKWYYEATLSAITGNTWCGVGWASKQSTSSSDNTGSITYVGADGTVNGAAGGPTYTAGDTIGVMIDLDNNLVYFSKNGTLINSGNGFSITAASATTTGFYFPALADYDATGTKTWVANFGQRPFAYTPPSGFVRLNTYNM